jgi:hypothetical protein
MHPYASRSQRVAEGLTFRNSRTQQSAFWLLIADGSSGIRVGPLCNPSSSKAPDRELRGWNRPRRHLDRGARALHRGGTGARGRHHPSDAGTSRSGPRTFGFRSRKRQSEEPTIHFQRSSAGHHTHPFGPLCTRVSATSTLQHCSTPLSVCSSSRWDAGSPRRGRGTIGTRGIRRRG